MILNSTAAGGAGSIHQHTMTADAIQQDPPCQLPLDVISVILRHLPATLFSKLSLVCNEWRTLVDNNDYPNKMVLPQNFNGPQRWKEYTNADAGEAPPLPKWVFKCMEKGGHMLTYIPETVKIQNEEGAESEMPINSLDKIGKLFANTINGRTMGFNSGSWQDPMKQVIPSEKGHWVLISKKALGKGLTYQEQIDEAKKNGANMSGSIDTVISLFMEYLRIGERPFFGDPADQKITIRVDAKTRRIWLFFMSSGLSICNCYGNCAYETVAFAPSWKFF